MAARGLKARCAAALLSLAVLTEGAAAQGRQSDLETAVKATFLYRFASFVEWPPVSSPSGFDVFVICIAGDRPFSALVEGAVAADRANGRRVAVRYYNALPDDPLCHVLYAAGRSEDDVASALRKVDRRPVLTVTDAEYGRTRGMIHFVLEGERVRFHIDRGAATAVRLKVNSRLLSIAVSVREASGENEP